MGSGILVPTLTRRYRQYTGTDLTLAPGLDSLVVPGCQATFRRADLLQDGDLPADSFDAIVCFSVLEHIADSAGAARGLARVLAPGGTLVTGYPMVSPLMTRAFSLLGFEGIDNHHVSRPRADRGRAGQRAQTGQARGLPSRQPHRRRALPVHRLDPLTAVTRREDRAAVRPETGHPSPA